jgi:diadenosine tetraphosphate (Ap4A) HIT family hydrolase
MGCPFCEMPRLRILRENSSGFLIYDGYPVTELHSLIIPKRHVADIWDLTEPETADCLELLRQQKDIIKTQDGSVQGFNVGVNVGEVAGQTVFHAHIHLIPRRIGDVDEPQGGVRGVIPSKRKYL